MTILEFYWHTHVSWSSWESWNVCWL